MNVTKVCSRRPDDFASSLDTFACYMCTIHKNNGLHCNDCIRHNILATFLTEIISALCTEIQLATRLMDNPPLAATQSSCPQMEGYCSVHICFILAL